MRRRQFLGVLGGAAVAWPLAARAQQVGKLPTLGVLMPNAAIAQTEWTSAFMERMRELGWIEGRLSPWSIVGRMVKTNDWREWPLN